MGEHEKSKLLNNRFLRISIFIVVLSYLILGTYWLYVTSLYTPMLIINFPTFSKLLKETWWIITYYSSELGLSAGIVLRWIAGILALYCAAVFLKEGEKALNRIRSKAGA
ncbi:hypothetical protein H5T51_08295, partial [Candidatus Bathyarchaeota archaeon]|nr:hypothetical protein [Candidatus Bathyarchaeota archaeon]